MWVNIALLLAISIAAVLAEDYGLEFGISKGVVINQIKDVVLYTEEQFSTFFVQDVPDIPTMTSFDCSERPFTESCELTARLNDINRDSIMLLSLMNKLFTKNGLKEDLATDPIKLDVDFQNADNGPTRSEALPDDSVISAAGADWFSMLRQRLSQRKVIESQDQPRAPRMERSPFWSGVAKVATTVAAAFGIDDLFNFFSETFVSKEKILNILTTLKAYLPVDRKSFAAVQMKTTELETFTKAKFGEIVKDNLQLRNITQHIDDLVKDHALDLSLIQESYSQTTRVLADTTTILFSTLVYATQMFGFQACRSRYLPHIYVPPSLLQETLAKLEESLDADTELAIPLKDSHLYYSLEKMSRCSYDGSGALLSLSVPLRQRSSILQLFEIRPLQYAWLNSTCVLQLDASYVVKDKRSSLIYPVTAVDELCNPKETKKCMVPVSTADDTTSSCVSIILSGGTAEEIKDGCPITCSPHSVPEIAKFGDSRFIATHIKPNSLQIVCPTENRTVTEMVDHGAISIYTTCGCRLYLDGRLITRSTQTICSDTDVVRDEAILPVHFTSHLDLIQFTDSSLDDAVKYKGKDEIFNHLFLQELMSEPDDSYLTSKLNLYALMWGIMQSLVSAFTYFKYNRLAALVIQMADKLPPARAANAMHCRLPPDAYYLLIAILVVSCVSVIPQLLFLLFQAVRNCFWSTVDIQVKKREVQRSEAGKAQQSATGKTEQASKGNVETVETFDNAWQTGDQYDSEDDDAYKRKYRGAHV